VIDLIKMTLEIVVKELNPILFSGSTGKIILSRSEDGTDRSKLYLYGHPKDNEVRTHAGVAEKFGVPHKLVLGGADVNCFQEYPPVTDYWRYKFTLHAFSGTYGGIPSVVVPALVAGLRSYLDNYDYNKGEEEIARIRYQGQLGEWREGVERAQRNFEGLMQNHQQESALFQKEVQSHCGWWNKRAAKKKRMPLEGFVIMKYELTVPQSPVPEPQPEQPEFDFKASEKWSKNNFLLDEPSIHNPHISTECDRWIKFLGYDWRER